MKKVDIYTDGACSGNPGPGGFGVVMLYNGLRKELSGGFRKTTNNRMEIMGIIRGLEALTEPCEINLYTDSKYVVDSIQKGWVKKWKSQNWMRTKNERALNVDLWEVMLALLQKHRVMFNWVKGHAQNIENNRCDELARQAISTSFVQIDENYEKSAFFS